MPVSPTFPARSNFRLERVIAETYPSPAEAAMAALAPLDSPEFSGIAVFENIRIPSLNGILKGNGVADVGVLPPDAGWGAYSGTAGKGIDNVYETGSISDPPTQGEMAEIASGLQATARRLKAMQDALSAKAIISA